MSKVSELTYIGIEASDLDAWEDFGINQLGMQLADRSADKLTMRMDDKSYRWYIQHGPANDYAFAGYECGTDADLDELVARLNAAGHTVQEGDAGLAAERKVRRIAVTTDPLGNRVELVVGHALAETPFKSGQLVSRFVTGKGGAGHMVLMEAGKERQTIVDFYKLLGFKLSDVIDEEIAPGMVASVAFLHCNERHHTLALANMPVPMKIHHFMMEVADINDVGYAWDRCLHARRQFEMTLGMHPNDNMFSFYVRTPSGFSIEYGWGGRLIPQDQEWPVGHYNKLNSWGHEPSKVVSELLAV